MKKTSIFLLIFLFSTFLNAEYYTILPYSIALKQSKSSLKESGTLNGIYFSSGTLSYLTEISYEHTDIRYKNTTYNLKQDEVTTKYSKYFINYSYTIGFHYNSTTDNNLQNGLTYIGALKRWKWLNNLEKRTYGMEIYHSTYSNGSDLSNNQKTINVEQITFFLNYYKIYSFYSNYFEIKPNIEYARTYNKILYSLNFQDVFYYKTFNISLSGFLGKLQTGIQNSGNTVINSKDIINYKLGIKINYSINKRLNIGSGYSFINVNEFNNKNVNNSTISITLGYKL